MEPPVSACDLREFQRREVPRGTYWDEMRRIRNNAAFEEIFSYFKHVGLLLMSYVSAYVNVSRVGSVPFYQRYLENIVFAIVYFYLNPNFKGVAQTILGAHIFWYIAPAELLKQHAYELWAVFSLALVLMVCDGFRGYCCVVSCIQLTLMQVVNNYEKVLCEWCLGTLLAMVIAISVFNFVPYGIEDIFLIFVIYQSVIYADTKYITKWLAWQILGVSIAWMIFKYIRIQRKYVNWLFNRYDPNTLGGGQ